MRTAYNFKRSRWEVKTTERLPAHDLVFGTPIGDPMSGLAIGSGDIGSLLWSGDSTLHIHINKTDLWDDSLKKDEIYCSAEEENLTALRHGGEIKLKFNTPCFDSIYQDEYEARLKLDEASANISAKTAFSKINIKAFSSAKTNVSVLYCDMETAENEAPEIELSRFGSRNLWRWYYQMKHDASVGLDGTETFSEKNRIYTTQKLNGTNFCIGLAVVTDEEYTAKLMNSHSARITLREEKKHSFKIFYTITLGKDTTDAKDNCKAALDNAIELGTARLFDEHKADWERFWNRSYIHISDDYLENIYYLSLYYSNCECRGAYPPNFTQGLWGCRHDFVPWNYYFYYNMQHMYSPLFAAGHWNLADNYYGMRARGIENAYRFARAKNISAGAFVHDVTDRYGFGADYDSDNHTPTPQLAMEMWRYYRYSGDEKFFKETALPFMSAAARMYISLLELGDDGYYHINETTAYEGNPITDNTVTDLAMIRALFPIVAKYDTEISDKCREILDALADFIPMPLGEHDIKDGKFIFGLGKGVEPIGDKTVIAYGTDKTGAPVRRGFGDPALDIYGFPDVELAPVYHSSLVGIAERGTPMYDRMYNQLMLHHENRDCMHWCMLPMYMSRLGVQYRFRETLRSLLNEWQVYPNGFDGDGPHGARIARERYVYTDSKNLENGKINRLDTSNFRYFDFETTPIVAHAISDSLLQSHGGIIRICPNIEDGDSASFKLYTEGGFIVEAEITESSYMISVESLRGEPCFIKLPEYLSLMPYIYSIENEKYSERTPVFSKIGNENILDLTDIIHKDEALIIMSHEIGDAEFEMPQNPAANDDMKDCGRAHLGSPKIR